MPSEDERKFNKDQEYEVRMIIPANKPSNYFPRIGRPVHGKDFFEPRLTTPYLPVIIGDHRINLYAGQSHINVEKATRYFDFEEVASPGSSSELGPVDFGLTNGQYKIRGGHHRLFFMFWQMSDKCPEAKRLDPRPVRIKFWESTGGTLNSGAVVKMEALTYKNSPSSA